MSYFKLFYQPYTVDIQRVNLIQYVSIIYYVVKWLVILPTSTHYTIPNTFSIWYYKLVTMCD